MGAADLVIAGLILAGSLVLLYRSLVKRRGCAGCDGGACGRPAASPVVRLGGGRDQRARRPGAAGGASSS